MKGPFAVLVNKVSDQDAFPQIVGPFTTRGEAEEFVEHYRKEDSQLTFTIAPMRSGGSFKQFMSW